MDGSYHLERLELNSVLDHESNLLNFRVAAGLDDLEPIPLFPFLSSIMITSWDISCLKLVDFQWGCITMLLMHKPDIVVVSEIYFAYSKLKKFFFRFRTWKILRVPLPFRPSKKDETLILLIL